MLISLSSLSLVLFHLNSCWLRGLVENNLAKDIKEARLCRLWGRRTSGSGSGTIDGDLRRRGIDKGPNDGVELDGLDAKLVGQLEDEGLDRDFLDGLGLLDLGVGVLGLGVLALGVLLAHA